MMASKSRSPQGECGLKYVLVDPQGLPHLSLPARGVWIEMSNGATFDATGKSRSPQGECGLKYHRSCRRSWTGTVAPRKGSVD